MVAAASRHPANPLAGGIKMKRVPLIQKILQLVSGAKKIAASVETAAATVDREQSTDAMRRSGFFGGAAALEEYYFPGELTGGVCPRIVGQEREIAWNAAAEACDTERVHLVWSVSDDKVWYLAARSSEFAAHPHTWCPFTSLLPGMSDAQPAPVCYAYYSDEAAIMLTVTEDSLQVHRGTTAVVRAKVERTLRDLGGGSVVTLDSNVIMKLMPVAWYSISLFEDRLRRILTMMVVFGGLSCALIAFTVWLVASLVILQHHRQLDDVQERTVQKTTALMETVDKLRASTLREQMARFAELNEGLVQVGGWMKFYQIKGDKVRWRALVPPSVTGEKIRELNGKLLSSNETGTVIGTDTNPAVKK